MADGALAQLLRGKARHTPTLQAHAGGGVEIGRDVALAHRGHGHDTPRRADGGGELRPHRCGIAVLGLTVVRHTGQDRAAASGRQRAVEQVAQTGGGLELHRRGSEFGGEGRKRAFLMRKREVVDIHVGDEDGVHGTGGQQGRFGERHEPHAGHIRIALVARVRKVGRLRATAGGDGQAIQHRDGGGLANVQLVSDIGQGLDGLGGHGHLDSGADRPVPPAECAGGQGAGDGTHGLEGRDWTLLPQIRDDARTHGGHLRVGFGLVGALTLGRRLALIALQRAQDRLGCQGSVGSDLLVEHPGGIGIHAGKRRVKPIGELRRRPPRRRALGVLPRILHAGNHIGQGSELNVHSELIPRAARRGETSSNTSEGRAAATTTSRPSPTRSARALA